MKKKIQRLLTSTVLALVLATFIVGVGLAASYIYTEVNLYEVSATDTPVSIYSGGCRSSYCKYLVQNSSNPSAWRWISKNASIMYWYAYCPTIGEAAARYGVRENSGGSWSIKMNQASANNQGSFVYLGYSDTIPLNGGYIMLHNGCVSGYYCGGLDVYWDDVIYVE